MKLQSEDYTHEGFYDYRQNVDFGSEALQSYYPYYYFLDWYLDNLSFEKYFKDSKLDRKSFTHNHFKLKNKMRLFKTGVLVAVGAMTLTETVLA